LTGALLAYLEPTLVMMKFFITLTTAVNVINC
jgi:hypothetical protein